MLLAQKNKLQPNLFFRNKHFNTLYRYLSYKNEVVFLRKRMPTSDFDFIDLDISSVQSDQAIIAIHGLEGSSNSSYIKSLTLFANQRNYDVIALNLRGCSGTPNLVLGSYHSGKTSDVAEVIQFVTKHYNYKKLHLVGYSLGGNITLKFMGELGLKSASTIQSAVAVSVPCDLKGAAETINRFSNKLYQRNFLKTLGQKAAYKLKQFPNANLNSSKILQAKNFIDFDEYFTAVTNGFKNADDYYKKSSSKQFLRHIKSPTLLISALDDPFLSDSCYPFEEAQNHQHFHLLTPKYGGHVGFYTHFDAAKNYWLEHQIINFIQKASTK